MTNKLVKTYNGVDKTFIYVSMANAIWDPLRYIIA